MSGGVSSTSGDAEQIPLTTSAIAVCVCIFFCCIWKEGLAGLTRDDLHEVGSVLAPTYVDSVLSCWHKFKAPLQV